jgi:DNA-binding CsgD family transcriptional regulator
MNPDPDGWDGMGDELDSWRTKLTDVQVRCLRLVAQGYTSKEIAKLLGLTPMTVDQYLHRAKQIIGAPDRRTAARLACEQRPLASFKPFELKAPTVAGQEPDMTLSEAPGGEAQEKTVADPWQVRLGFPPLGGIRSDLDATQKTRAILRIAGLALIYTTAFALVLGGSLKAFS